MFRLINRFIRTIHRLEAGITGLETAIVLIAFVMVASTLAYVVVSAGLYSSQRFKLAYETALETMSVVNLKGDIMAKMENSEVTEIYLFVSIPAAGNSIDFNNTGNITESVVISYMDDDDMLPSANWTLQKLSTTNTDNLLDRDELFLVTIDLSAVNISLRPRETFFIEIKPPIGPVLPIERTIPGRTSQYVNLH